LLLKNLLSLALLFCPFFCCTDSIRFDVQTGFRVVVGSTKSVWTAAAGVMVLRHRWLLLNEESGHPSATAHWFLDSTDPADSLAAGLGGRNDLPSMRAADVGNL
jgi:hypothetical protein